MKNIITKICLLFIFINGKAQTPVLDLSQLGWENITGAYYKDTQNLLNPFVGTYIYSNGTTSFKIVLKKKEMPSVNASYYEDMIIGEYQYIENGIQKVSTLGSLMFNHPDAWSYSMQGNFIIEGKELGCDECADTEKRLQINISDIPTERIGDLYIRRIMQGSQAAITVNLRWDVNWRRRPSDPVTQPARIPNGTYVMIKQ